MSWFCLLSLNFLEQRWCVCIIIFNFSSHYVSSCSHGSGWPFYSDFWFWSWIGLQQNLLSCARIFPSWGHKFLRHWGKIIKFQNILSLVEIWLLFHDESCQRRIWILQGRLSLLLRLHRGDLALNVDCWSSFEDSSLCFVGSWSVERKCGSLFNNFWLLAQTWWWCWILIKRWTFLFLRFFDLVNLSRCLWCMLLRALIWVSFVNVVFKFPFNYISIC